MKHKCEECNNKCRQVRIFEGKRLCYHCYVKKIHPIGYFKINIKNMSLLEEELRKQFIN